MSKKKQRTPPGAGEIRKKLGKLAERRLELVRDVIVDRGGSAANVKMAGPWADRTLEETALNDVAGNPEARKALKIVKQASRRARDTRRGGKWR